MYVTLQVACEDCGADVKLIVTEKLPTTEQRNLCNNGTCAREYMIPVVIDKLAKSEDTVLSYRTEGH